MVLFTITTLTNSFLLITLLDWHKFAIQLNWRLPLKLSMVKPPIKTLKEFKKINIHVNFIVFCHTQSGAVWHCALIIIPSYYHILWMTCHFPEHFSAPALWPATKLLRMQKNSQVSIFLFIIVYTTHKIKWYGFLHSIRRSDI